MNPALFHLESNKVILRGFVNSDTAHLLKWYNDPEILRLTAETEPLSQENARAFLKTIKTDKNRIWFMILDKATDKPIGECGLLRIFRPWKTADLTMVIGEKRYWGKGHSHDAMRLLLDFTFASLKLHRLSVGVLETNERAIRFYKRFGFREEGRQRHGFLSDGKYADFVMMSLLEGEYQSTAGTRTQASSGQEI